MRLAELNKQTEDPEFWNDAARAQKVMRERTALEDQLNAIGRIERELDDQLMLIELGEAENDQGVIAEAEATLKKLKDGAAILETKEEKKTSKDEDDEK